MKQECETLPRLPLELILWESRDKTEIQGSMAILSCKTKDMLSLRDSGNCFKFR